MGTKLDSGFADRLAQSIVQSDKKLEQHRKNRQVFEKHYTGLWGAGPESRQLGKRNSLNIIYKYVSTMTAALYTAPSFKVAAKQPSLIFFSHIFSEALNRTWQACNPNPILRSAIKSSLYGRGIIWSGVAEKNTKSIRDPQGYMDTPGQFTIKEVSEYDFVEDMNARTDEEVDYRGHRYRVPYVWAMESGIYDKKAIEQAYLNETQNDQKPKLNTPLYDTIEMISLWLPKENMCVDIPAGCNMIARESEYDGPEDGPYTVLKYDSVPESLIPLGPVSVVFELNSMINLIFSKMREQAERQKEIYAAPHSKIGNAKNIANLPDGEIIDGIPEIAKQTYGGADPRHMAVMNYYKNELNQISGNPDAIGGAGAISNTLGQDQLIYSNAMATLNDKKRIVRDFYEKLGRKAAYYLWTDDTQDFDMLLNIPGTMLGKNLPATWTKGEREGEMIDYVVKVSPFASIQDDSPEAAYKMRKDFLASVLVPLSPMEAQKGRHLDTPRIADTMAADLGLTEWQGIFNEGEAILQPFTGPGASGESGGGVRSMAKSAPGPEAPEQAAEAAPQKATAKTQEAKAEATGVQI